MAKLSAHGTKIGQIEFSTYAKAYMSDGKVLRNDGFGWKSHASLKSGVTPQQAFDNAKEAQRVFFESRPCLKAYRRELHAMAGLCKSGSYMLPYP